MSPHDLLLGPFLEFSFMRRALAGCVALATSSAPVGVFLMLRRMSLMGDAMAHAILPGAAVGFLLAGLSVVAMTTGGLMAGLLVVLLAGLLSRATTLGEDASLAGFYLVSLAGGVLLVSLRGSSIDLMHVLFGTVLALDDQALLLLGGVATITLVTLALIYRGLVLECVDPTFLRAVGGPGTAVHLAFLALVVLNLVGGFQALGTLMAVGLMMLPATAARFWARELGPLLAVAVLVALVGSYAGLLVSYHAGLPSGPAIVLAVGALWALSILLGHRGGLLARCLLRRQVRA